MSYYVKCMYACRHIIPKFCSQKISRGKFLSASGVRKIYQKSFFFLMKTYDGKLCSLITGGRFSCFEAKRLITPLLVAEISYQFLKNEDGCNKTLDVFSLFPIEFFIDIIDTKHIYKRKPKIPSS